MNRRQAIGAMFTAAAVSSVLRPGRLLAQETGTKAMAAEGNTIYLHPARGADTNSGAKDNPLRTLAEAARRVNQSNGPGAMTIVLSEGIYAVGETTLLKPERRSFSKTERLTIRAEVLPDDPDWNTGSMPTLIHTMPIPPTWNGRPDPLGGAADGMMIETSHVTIQGLKILGLPVVETPKPGLIRRLYGISRLRRDLEDLEIAQCLFAGDEVTNPNHVSIIANGNGVNVHHCIFRGMKISVVYWTGGSGGHAMRNCICDGVYGSGVWTAGIKDDFDYRNNVIMNGNYVWTYQGGASALADAGGRGGRQAAPRPGKAAGAYTLQSRRQLFRQQPEAHRLRNRSQARIPGYRFVVPRNGRNEGHGSIGRPGTGPDQAELPASSRRIGSGQNRRWPFPEADGVTWNCIPGFSDIDPAIFAKPTGIYEHR